MTLLALLTSPINAAMIIPTKAPALSIAALLGVVLWLAEWTEVAALVHLVDQEVWLPLDVFPVSVVMTGVTTLAHHVGQVEVRHGEAQLLHVFSSSVRLAETPDLVTADVETVEARMGRGDLPHHLSQEDPHLPSLIVQA